MILKTINGIVQIVCLRENNMSEIKPRPSACDACTEYKPDCPGLIDVTQCAFKSAWDGIDINCAGYAQNVSKEMNDNQNRKIRG